MTKPKEKTVDKKSIHRIELTPGRYIEPNTVFGCPVDQIDWLTENGAITDVKRLTAADAMALPVPSEAAAELEVPLDEMTDEALADVATGLGIKVGKNWKRTTVLKRITTAQAAALVGDDEDDDPEGLV